MIITDPVFLEIIKKLREQKPTNYQWKEINTYNNGQDAIEQEIQIIGNSLTVLEIPELFDIYIQFNEPENAPIKLRRGIILFDFYRFFLTYQHTEDNYYLKLLIGKDLIVGQYPLAIEKNLLIIVNSENFTIPSGSGYYPLPCKYANYPPLPTQFLKKNFNHLRGIVSLKQGTASTKTFRIAILDALQKNYDYPFCYAEDFSIDLCCPRFEFYMKELSSSYTISLYAELWGL